MMITHSFEPDLNQRPMDYKLALLQSTGSTNWAIEGFDDREWHFISCELLVHNAFVKKKNYTSLLRAGFEPATNGLQTCFTTAHRSTNWAIEGLTIVSDISFHVNC